MYCLYCGDCCIKMSPISNPCPNAIRHGTFVFCREYERRPEQCVNHTFHGARFCPIGLDVLNLSYPEDTEKIRIRIDEGYDTIKGYNKIYGLDESNE